MKKLFLLFITILSTNLTFSQTTKVVVNNSYEFIDALGSNKIIEIAADLNINDLDPNITGKHYKINTEWYAHTLVLFGLYNTEIIGQGATPKQITNSNVYSEVLQFENCTNIKIKNIEGGHGPRKGEACYGGVLTFINCQTVSILNSIMYGSGSCGITAVDVKGLKCTKSVIHGCTQHGFLLRNSSNIEFDECDIFNNDFYTLFDINNCMNITMNSCKIKNNHPAYLNDENDLDPNCGTSGYFFLFDISESMSVTVKNCKIQNNFACFLMNKSNAAAFENTTIENNEFSFIPSSDNTSSDVPSSDATSSGSSPSCDQFCSDYEEFVDSYIAILKKQKANPTDASIMAEYSQIMSKLAALQKDSKDCAGNPEFAARIAKIAAKLAAAASGM